MTRLLNSDRAVLFTYSNRFLNSFWEDNNLSNFYSRAIKNFIAKRIAIFYFIINNELSFTQHQIENRIFTIRGAQVMIDRDLADMYQVETRVLNQAVKRNQDRFPEDFCFQLTESEFENWKSQIMMSNSDNSLDTFIDLLLINNLHFKLATPLV